MMLVQRSKCRYLGDLISEDQSEKITIDLQDLPTKIRRGHKHLTQAWMNLLL